VGRIKCRSQCEVVEFQIISYSVNPCGARTSYWSFLILQRKHLVITESNVEGVTECTMPVKNVTHRNIPVYIYFKIEILLFGMFYADEPVISMFMAPSVTPWFSTVPGVGSNNPGVRLYKYSRETGHIVDYTQYFLNLSAADAAGHDNWRVEYRATEAYGITAVDAASWNDVIQQFISGSQSRDLFGRYYRYNSVSRDLSNCTGECMKRHICAASEVELDKYSQCLLSAHWPHRYPYSTVSTTPKSHHHHRRMRTFTYFLLGSLILVIAVLFLLLAVCCCQRRHAVVYFSRSHYSLVQGT